MAPQVAVYRGRFDPPGVHHIDAVRALLARFDRVVVMPWGPMSHRAIDENIAPALRAHLIDLAFQKLDRRVIVDLMDIEHATITSSTAVEAAVAAAVAGATPPLTGCEVFHVVEAASYDEDMASLHAGARVVVVAAEGTALPAQVNAPVAADTLVVRVPSDVAGAVMRKRLYAGQAIDDLVPADVAAAVTRYSLYRGMPRSTTKHRIDKPRLMLVADERNERAMRWSARFARYAVDSDPNLIVVFGGDGSMLRAIQQHWRLRVPFFGVNAGHLGFLLNDASEIGLDGDVADPVAALWEQELLVHHMPMLYVELMTRADGLRSGLTFNDAWVERSTGQSAWIEVTVDERVRLPKVVCDGVLVSTAAGSTAYARSMGAMPLLADTAAWLLVGSNVMEPLLWKSSLLSTSSMVVARSLDVDKRPLVGYLHGVSMGEIIELRARLSRSASVELAFLGAHDMAEKIARIQFPS